MYKTTNRSQNNYEYDKIYYDLQEIRLSSDDTELPKLGYYIEAIDPTAQLLISYQVLKLQFLTEFQRVTDQITDWCLKCKCHPNLINQIDEQSAEIRKLKEALNLDKMLLSKYEYKLKAILKEHMKLMTQMEEKEYNDGLPNFSPHVFYKNGMTFSGQTIPRVKETQEENQASNEILPIEYEQHFELYHDHVAQLHNIFKQKRDESEMKRKKWCQCLSAAITRAYAADNKFCNLNQQLVLLYKKFYLKQIKWLEEEERLLHTVKILNSDSQKSTIQRQENTKDKKSQRNCQEQKTKYYKSLALELEDYQRKYYSLERSSEISQRDAERQQVTLQKEVKKLTSTVDLLSNQLQELDGKRKQQVKFFHSNLKSLHKRLKTIKENILNNSSETCNEHLQLNKEISETAELLLKNGQQLNLELEDLIKKFSKMECTILK